MSSAFDDLRNGDKFVRSLLPSVFILISFREWLYVINVTFAIVMIEFE